ncbi:MAG: metallophosphoesterase [Candidatus Eisenbacteria bacterium]|nr:metallophosphoesterase [Candidatus Eisenbacteria bacterium]
MPNTLLQKTSRPVLPAYQGLKWLQGELPREIEPWPKFASRRTAEAAGDRYDASWEEVRRSAAGKPWVWPKRRVHFLCDLHADTEAFHRSLIATGGVVKTGPGDGDLELTPAGTQALFIFGGDLFDKGPATLRLLNTLQSFLRTGARVLILAGNHDLRAIVGLRYAGHKETHLAHLFIRMGKKSIPLFREIYDRYLAAGSMPRRHPSDDEVSRLLFPDAGWFERFPREAAGLIPEIKIAAEVVRIQEKLVEFMEGAEEHRMTLGMIHAAYLKARELFLEPGGGYRWLFERMTLAFRAGSFLFIHAGLDDDAAALLRREGVAGLNRRFRSLFRDNLFELYHGYIGNMFRTKYRPKDLPLTWRGLRDTRRAGIYAIVHGHRIAKQGHRLALRNGLLNFECDTAVDRHTRRQLGLEGPGASALVLQPSGVMLGISSDYPYAKILNAADVFDFTAIA